MSNVVAHQYNFELETLITQFIALIDGAIIIRYNVDEATKQRIFVDTIKPWYVFGPKHRVMHNLVNKAKTYSLPFVTINITGIEGNTDRLAAKHTIIKRHNGVNTLGYNRPTPITISLQVTITTDRMTDLYQIYSKLSTQFQPYCAFSWYVPYTGSDKTEYEELTGKAEWDFNISFDVKDQLKETDKEEFSGTMNFKMTGWMFPTNKQCVGGIIYDIGTSNIIDNELRSRVINFENTLHPLVSEVMEDKNYEKYDNPREWANAHPRIVNVFQTIKVNNKLINFLMDKERMHPIVLDDKKSFTLDGYNLKNVQVLFVPKDKNSIETTLEKVSYNYKGESLFPKRGGLTKKRSTIEGYKMNITEQTANKVTVNLKDIDYQGDFDIIVADLIDYDSTDDVLGKQFESK